jgi:hypothetical protein
MDLEDAQIDAEVMTAIIVNSIAQTEWEEAVEVAANDRPTATLAHLPTRVAKSLS